MCKGKKFQAHSRNLKPKKQNTTDFQRKKEPLFKNSPFFPPSLYITTQTVGGLDVTATVSIRSIELHSSMTKRINSWKFVGEPKKVLQTPCAADGVHQFQYYNRQRCKEDFPLQKMNKKH